MLMGTIKLPGQYDWNCIHLPRACACSCKPLQLQLFLVVSTIANDSYHMNNPDSACLRSHEPGYMNNMTQHHTSRTPADWLPIIITF